jgi:hypothetical protein
MACLISSSLFSATSALLAVRPVAIRSSVADPDANCTVHSVPGRRGLSAGVDEVIEAWREFLGSRPVLPLFPSEKMGKYWSTKFLDC